MRPFPVGGSWEAKACCRLREIGWILAFSYSEPIALLKGKIPAMTLEHISLEAMGSDDLQNLIDNKVGEGLRIDYKRDTYKHGDDGKLELLKDVSGFANASGGHLVIGMDEVDGVPTALHGIDGNAEEECAWLNNLCLTCLEPRIAGLQFHPISLPGGRHVIVIRIPRSWNPPHAARLGKHRRFHIRHSASTNEASMEELRMLFTLSTSLRDRMREFRGLRILEITGNSTPADLKDSGRLIVHVIPFLAFAEPFAIDFSKLTRGGHNFMPLGGGGFNPLWNFDGYLAAVDGRYSQLYRNGIIEGAAGGILRNPGRDSPPTVYAETIEDAVLETMVGYLSTLKILDVPPPYAAFVSFQGIRGSSIVGNHVGFGPRSMLVRQDDLLFPEIVVSDAGDLIQYQADLRPIFDALWNVAGYPRSNSYDHLGQWSRAR
jgi:hypothetical protein